MIVHNKWAVRFETTAKTTDNKPDHPNVCNAASGVEILDRQLTNDGDTESTTDLSTGSVIGPVPV